MDDPKNKTLSKAEKKLLEFLNPVDGPDIAESLRSVLKMALMEQWKTLTEEQKDDLYILEKLTKLIDTISKT